MKKLLFGLACAAALAGAANNIESANVVGFTQKTIAADTYYMIGVQFQQMGSTTKQVSMADLITLNGIAPVSYEEMEDKAAQIQVRVGDFYVPYYYISDASAYDENGTYIGDVEGWCNGSADLISEEDLLTLGNGFWFKAPVIQDGASITVKGEVSDATSLAVNFNANQFAIIANPFPATVSLKNLSLTGVTPVSYENMEDEAIQIQVRDGEFYIPYYYISDASNYDENGEYIGDVEGWCDGSADIAPGDEIECGASFWVKSPTTGSLTFTR